MRVDRIMRRLKRDISAYQIALPIENLDQYMSDILVDTTLPVFSIYQPRYEFISCYTNEFDTAPNDRCDHSDLYILPDHIFNGRELLYVRAVEYASDGMSEHRASQMHGLTTVRNGGIGSDVSYLSSLLIANATKPMVDLMLDPVTFHFTYPRKLYIYDSIMSSRLRLTLACEHDTSMLSIPPTAAESFYQLALLDIEAALFNIVKHYDGKGGIHDTQEFKIDDWANAKNDRKELLKEWDEVFMLDQGNYDFG